MNEKELKRSNRELKKHLSDLVDVVEKCVKSLDDQMAKPSTFQRGNQIASIINALEMQKDIAKRFGLSK